MNILNLVTEHFMNKLVQLPDGRKLRVKGVECQFGVWTFTGWDESSMDTMIGTVLTVALPTDVELEVLS